MEQYLSVIMNFLLNEIFLSIFLKGKVNEFFIKCNLFSNTTLTELMNFL